jgi:hypothetical protein
MNHNTLTPTETPHEVAIKIPSNQYLLQEYKIEIEFMARGCVIKVGCKQIPFESVEEAMNELNEYVKNPCDVQQKWRELLG